MRQYLIDTNCILRYLLNDLPDQAQVIEDYFKQAKNLELLIKIPLLVFVELDFTLSKYYRYSKNKVIKNIDNILHLEFLDIEKKDLLIKALSLYSQKNISFVDAIFYTQAKMESRELLTFDTRLKKLRK